jgi:hypothetical protein
MPADLDQKLEIVEPRPVYVPFYCFSVNTTTSFSVDIGTTTANGLYSFLSIFSFGCRQYSMGFSH